MNSRRLLISIVGISALLFCLPAAGFAASTVTISPGSDGVFLVQGTGIEGAAAMEINIGYDLSTLSNPRVVEGPLISGAMTAVNPNVPGMVRIVVVRLSPISGSGLIATVSFDTRGSSPGMITSLNARFADSQGSPLAVLAQINNPNEGTKTTSQDTQTTQEAAAGAVQVASVVPPKTIIAGPSEKSVETKGTPEAQGAGSGDDRAMQPDTGRDSRQGPAVISGAAESASSAGEPASRATTTTRRIYGQKSVLERFQEYRGPRTAEAFIALFEQDSLSLCHQDPPIAIADGKTPIRVTFVSAPGKKSAADIAVMGARMRSLKEDPDTTNTWIAEIVPEKGEYRVSLAVSQGPAMMVCPLTISPRVAPDRAPSGTVTKADLDRYISVRGKAAAAGRDMNRDGKQDYVDDYIITANYLSAAIMPQGTKPN